MFKPVAIALLLTASTAAYAADVRGPIYPAPGSGAASGSGNAGTGTRTVTYIGFDLSQTNALYWGITSLTLAMDGSVDTAGETLSFNAGQSDLAHGLAVFTGSTTINQFGSNYSVDTRFLLNAYDLSNNALALTTTGTIGASFADVPLVEVLGDFKVTQQFQASYHGSNSWAPSTTFFNNAPGKPPVSGLLLSGSAGNYFYTENAVPEPASWAMLTLGFGALGGAIRKQRGSVRFA